MPERLVLAAGFPGQARALDGAWGFTKWSRTMFPNLTYTAIGGCRRAGTQKRRERRARQRDLRIP
eukprot:scaffold2415_cov111-Isochrysis_galbana.AAC.2